MLLAYWISLDNGSQNREYMSDSIKCYTFYHCSRESWQG